MDLVERCRRHGKERLEWLEKVKTDRSWLDKWTDTRYPFAIEWGDCWKAIAEIPVTDFVADLGFFVDILGFVTNAFDDNYAMIMSPDQSYTFTIIPASNERPAPDCRSIRLEFMVNNVESLSVDLVNRGIELEKPIGPEPGMMDKLLTFSFHSPSGLPIKIWGLID